MSSSPAECAGVSWESARRLVGEGMLSILMPARNLAPVILANVREVRAFFAGRIPFEIIVIDDGSTDGTGAELRKHAAELPELRVVVLQANAGKGAALRHGFDASRGTHVAFLDADLDLSPSLLPHFFEVMERANADIVIGSKRHPQSVLDYPPFRRLVSSVYYFIVKLMFGLPIRDTQTGIKLFKRAAVAWVFPRMLVKHFAFDLEILSIAHERGFRIAEAPVVLDFHGGGLGCARPSAVRSVLHDTLAVFYRLKVLKYYQSIPDPRMPDPPPLVSIIIAYPGPTAYLDEALAGIDRQTYRHFEVILLPDEASGRVWGERIREVPTGQKRPAAKRNTGLAHARGEIVAFLDDDAYPAADWLAQALGYFADPAVGAVGGPGVTPPNDPYLAQVSGWTFANRLVSGGFRYRYEPDRVRAIDDYPSCNLFVRADCMREIGGFRTDYWPGEDTYLCMELVHRKRKIFYEPRSLVYHHRRRVFLPHLRQVGRYGLHRGYFARHFPTNSRRLSYMIPSLFVAGVLAGGVLAALWPPVRPLYAGALAAYVLITLGFTFSRRLADWLLTWLAVVMTHFVYGVRFAWGWFTPHLPGEVQRFDHPSEGASR